MFPYAQRRRGRETGGAAAIALLAEGRLEEALALAQAETLTHPEDPGALAAAAHCLLALHRYPQAIDAFETALLKTPESAALYDGLGRACQACDRHSQAIDAFNRSIELDPNQPQSHLALASLLADLGSYEQAMGCARRAVELSPQSSQARIVLARTLTEANRPDEAESWLQEAVRLDRRAVVASSLWLQARGRFAEAEPLTIAGTELRPPSGRSYELLVRSRKITFKDRGLIDRMERLAGLEGISPIETAYLHYALGKAYDDCQEFESAIGHFHAANRLMGGGHEFDRARYAAVTDQIIESISPGFLEKAGQGSDSNVPIFIVGMMRSGTTLLEQMLSAHSQVAAAGELRFWLIESQRAVDWRRQEAIDLARGAERYLSTLAQVGMGKARVTDKMPFNYLWVGLIHAALPNARFIHVRRNPADTCLSIYFTPFQRSPGWDHDPGSLVFAYREYERLMAHWKTLLPPGVMVETQYESLIQSPSTEMRRILEFCGLPWEEACLHPERNARTVSTPSLWQVRRPLYSSSVGRWRNYEPWLGEFGELIEPGS